VSLVDNFEKSFSISACLHSLSREWAARRSTCGIGAEGLPAKYDYWTGVVMSTRSQSSSGRRVQEEEWCRDGRVGKLSICD
jgi:hypothetical protein